MVNSNASRIDGVTKDAIEWFCDGYTGTGDALVAAGLVTAAQLLPQEGRRFGRAAFFPDGSPVPKGINSSRIPGYKVVTDLGAGRFRVAITKTKEEQEARQAADAAKREVEQEDRREQELVVDMSKLLEHEWSPWCEVWRGTKAQLQAIGLGVGVAFPGEVDAPCCVHVIDPDGWPVEIDLQTCDKRSDVCPGYRYVARSRYLPIEPQPDMSREHAPGVHVTPYFWSDRYTGTAPALVAAGLARADQFPGQPGRGKTRNSYHADGSTAYVGSGSAHRTEGYFTIVRAGRSAFRIEVTVSEEERERRLAALEKCKGDPLMREARRARMVARGVDPESVLNGEPGIPAALLRIEAALARIEEERRKVATGEDFRRFILARANAHMGSLWSNVLCSGVGGFSLNLKKGSDAYDEIAEAFESIRETIGSAPLIRDKAASAAAALERKAGAAKADAAFLAFMQRTQQGGEKGGGLNA